MSPLLFFGVSATAEHAGREIMFRRREDRSLPEDMFDGDLLLFRENDEQDDVCSKGYSNSNSAIKLRRRRGEVVVE
jgi:hypothetical protein